MTIRTLDHLIDSGQSFVYETTLSSRQSVRLVGKARLAGFSVALFFLALENVELHIERVGHRVSLGGHAIPSEAIRRRYATSFSNLRAILPQVDQAVLIDNSGISGMRIIARLVRSSLISSDFDSGSNVDRLVAGCLEEALGIRIGTVG